MKYALNIRVMKYGEKHESVADCWFNMAIIYKIIKKNFKVSTIFVYHIYLFNQAIKMLEKALHLRKQLIGEASLAYAQVYNEYKPILNFLS